MRKKLDSEFNNLNLSIITLNHELLKKTDLLSIFMEHQLDKYSFGGQIMGGGRGVKKIRF